MRNWIIPAGMLALAAGSIAMAHSTSGHMKAAAGESSQVTPQTITTESPAPTATPKVTINGTEIPVMQGTRDLTIPGGKAHVEVSGGHTQISTKNSGSGDTSNTSSANVHIDVNSSTSSSSSNDSSTSFSSTSVFSNGNGEINISQ